MSKLRSASACSVAGMIALTACGGSSNQETATSTSTSTSSGAGTGGGAGGAGMGGSAGTGGTGTGPFTPAAHPTLPQVKTFGGPVLKTPKLQPIAYMSDPNTAELEKFFKELTTTPYWSDTTSEYGVGPLTILPTIVRMEAAPPTIVDSTVQQDLTTNLSGASPAWGAADASTIYLFLFPPGTVVSDGFGGTGCQDFDGYHDETSVGSVTVPYAISCSCHGFDGKAVADLQQRTVNISHELVEAATDPYPNSNTAYGQTDDADIVWTFATGGEVADMCEFNDDTYVIPPGSTYMVQRSWSNKAAKALTDPCVPLTAKGPYFNTAPVLPDKLIVSGVSTPGVKIAVGSSKTIDVTLFSEAVTTGTWKVNAYDMGAYLTGSADLQLSLDKGTGKNGDTLHLTIKVLKANPNGSGFILVSDLGTGTSLESNLAMGMVGQ